MRRHRKEIVARVKQLHAEGQGYRRIVRAIEDETGVKLGQSTVRDWLAYNTRPMVPVAIRAIAMDGTPGKWHPIGNFGSE